MLNSTVHEIRRGSAHVPQTARDRVRASLVLVPEARHSRPQPYVSAYGRR